MAGWAAALRMDPRPLLISSKNPAIAYLARRDLDGETLGSPRTLWELPECQAIVKRQSHAGRWRYAGARPGIRSHTNYDQLETYRQLGFLVEKFELTNRYAQIRRAANFLIGFQTAASDFRGIYGRQYTPNYSAAIAELLIKARYANSRKIRGVLEWLVSMRQDDGGWAIPLRTRGKKLDAIAMRGKPLEPDRSKPSAHLVTGIVLRAFAVHPRHVGRSEVRQAGALLKSRFFQRDRYVDHVGTGHWTNFSYPFWWTDLLSSLDSLTRIGFTRDDPDIARAIDWFIDHQQANGLWRTGRNRPKNPFSDQWGALTICRVLKRTFSN